MAGEYRKYASKSHHHRPAKGKGSYRRDLPDCPECDGAGFVMDFESDFLLTEDCEACNASGNSPEIVQK